MDLYTLSHIQQQHPKVWALLARSKDTFCLRMRLDLEAGRDIAPNQMAALLRIIDRRKLGRRY